jgi:hypothetical protein
MDATTALSEDGVNVVLHKMLASAHTIQGDNETWGPFFASYAVSVALSSLRWRTRRQTSFISPTSTSRVRSWARSDSTSG